MLSCRVDDVYPMHAGMVTLERSQRLDGLAAFGRGIRHKIVELSLRRLKERSFIAMTRARVVMNTTASAHTARSTISLSRTRGLQDRAELETSVRSTESTGEDMAGFLRKIPILWDAKPGVRLISCRRCSALASGSRRSLERSAAVALRPALADRAPNGHKEGVSKCMTQTLKS